MMKINRVKKWTAVLTVVAAVVALAGCGNDKKEGNVPHKEAQKIVVATRGTAKPFTYTDDKETSPVMMWKSLRKWNAVIRVCILNSRQWPSMLPLLP